MGPLVWPLQGYKIKYPDWNYYDFLILKTISSKTKNQIDLELQTLNSLRFFTLNFDNDCSLIKTQQQINKNFL